MSRGPNNNSEQDCLIDCDICRHKNGRWCEQHDMPINSVQEHIRYNIKQYEQANDEFDLR